MGSQKSNKIEPHVILHLRINQDDINRYLKNKIQTDPSDLITDLEEPKPYEPCNINTMTNTFTLNDPTPANLEYDQFTNFNVENKVSELENSPTNSISNNSISTNSISTNSISTNSISTNSISTNSISTNSNSTNSNSTNSNSTNSISTNSVSNNSISNNSISNNSISNNTNLNRKPFQVSLTQHFKEYLTVSNKENIEELEHSDKNHFLSIPHINLDETPDYPKPKPSEDINSSDTKIKIVAAMCEFADANRRKEWIKSTSIWCRWCAHPFTGPPVAIPKWYVNKTFFVSGCYCSYSCAAKHLFSKADVNENDKWKYYHLLHLLRNKILGTPKNIRIKLAPPQDTLKVFGGHLSINDFRNTTKEGNIHHKIYNILIPPLVSIIPTIEETTYPNSNSDMRLLNTPGGMRAYGNMKYVAPKNESYSSSTRWGQNKSYIPIDKERMKRAVENLKVSRKAPLLDKKKTLLHYMNLKINRNKKNEQVEK
jgi:hypothetical protein